MHFNGRSGMTVIKMHFGLSVDIQGDAARPSMARSTAASMFTEDNTTCPKCIIIG